MSKVTKGNEEHFVNLETLGTGACNELFDDAFQKVLDNIAYLGEVLKPAGEIAIPVFA